MSKKLESKRTSPASGVMGFAGGWGGISRTPHGAFGLGTHLPLGKAVTSLLRVKKDQRIFQLILEDGSGALMSLVTRVKAWGLCDGKRELTLTCCALTSTPMPPPPHNIINVTLKQAKEEEDGRRRRQWSGRWILPSMLLSRPLTQVREPLVPRSPT